MSMVHPSTQQDLELSGGSSCILLLKSVSQLSEKITEKNPLFSGIIVNGVLFNFPFVCSSFIKTTGDIGIFLKCLLAYTCFTMLY